jgi:hypothetical protein
MMRCEQPGWIQIANHDPSGRRGLWYRVSASPGDDPKACIEVCSGREGDDSYVKLSPGQTLTDRDIYDLFDVLMVAADVLYCNPVPTVDEDNTTETEEE